MLSFVLGKSLWSRTFVVLIVMTSLFVLGRRGVQAGSPKGTGIPGTIGIENRTSMEVLVWAGKDTPANRKAGIRIAAGKTKLLKLGGQNRFWAAWTWAVGADQATLAPNNSGYWAAVNVGGKLKIRKA